MLSDPPGRRGKEGARRPRLHRQGWEIWGMAEWGGRAACGAREEGVQAVEHVPLAVFYREFSLGFLVSPTLGLASRPCPPSARGHLSPHRRHRDSRGFCWDLNPPPRAVSLCHSVPGDSQTQDGCKD